MKGLLLKDFYMLWKYCKVILVFMAVMLIGSFYTANNFFFIVYPCVIAGMLPVTLISYDERDRWDLYSRTLPYSAAQIVSSKYVTGIVLSAAVLGIAAVTQAVRMLFTSSFFLNTYLSLMASLFTLSFAGTSLILPIMFRMGAERGRIFYYFLIGALCAGGAIFSELGSTFMVSLNGYWIPAAVMGVILILYLISWKLSIRFYQKREI